MYTKPDFAKFSLESYYNTIIIPFLPKVYAHALRSDILDEVTPGMQRLLERWTNEVLGPKEHGVVEKMLERLQFDWPCTCASCKRARAALPATGTARTRLEGVGGVSRRHVKQTLTSIDPQRKLATYEPYSSVPQGMTVSPSPTFYLV